MQASRTISAFTVVIITIAILWYVGASSCTSFFFAFQGFLPMQARPTRSHVLMRATALPTSRSVCHRSQGSEQPLASMAHAYGLAGGGS